jgi:hypothetical protein
VIRDKIDDLKLYDPMYKVQQMSVLHTLHDGSTLQIMSAREISMVPNWQGNRIMDRAHLDVLRRSVGADIRTIDVNPFRMVVYEDKDATGRVATVTQLVDGQHRAELLREHFGTTLCEDFPVIVIVKHVESELEIIEYFNAVNANKPITWSDPSMIVNKYIQTLELAFNTVKRCPYIRNVTTRRPYLAVERLREGLLACADRLRAKDASLWVARVQAWNEREVREAELRTALGEPNKMMSHAIEIRFMLGMDARLSWIAACLL